MIKCEYCKKDFTNKTTLKRHQNKTQYCLKIQEKQNKFTCSFCNKILSTEKKLSTHHNLCNKKIEVSYENIIQGLNYSFEEKKKEYEKEINKRDLRIKELENKLEDILFSLINKPTNICNYILNVDDKFIKNKF